MHELNRKSAKSPTSPLPYCTQVQEALLRLIERAALRRQPVASASTAAASAAGLAAAFTMSAEKSAWARLGSSVSSGPGVPGTDAASETRATTASPTKAAISG